MLIAHIIAVLALLAAGTWDVYVIRRHGLGSGKTVSWRLYTLARDYPAVAYLSGLITAWMFPQYKVACLVFLVMGHIFGTMRGA